MLQAEFEFNIFIKGWKTYLITYIQYSLNKRTLKIQSDNSEVSLFVEISYKNVHISFFLLDEFLWYTTPNYSQ